MLRIAFLGLLAFLLAAVSAPRNLCDGRDACGHRWVAGSGPNQGQLNVVNNGSRRGTCKCDTEDLLCKEDPNNRCLAKYKGTYTPSAGKCAKNDLSDCTSGNVIATISANGCGDTTPLQFWECNCPDELHATCWECSVVASFTAKCDANTCGAVECP